MRQAFEKGVLWLQFLGPDTLLCQGRFTSLKIFNQQQDTGNTSYTRAWTEQADFLIRCRLTL